MLVTICWRPGADSIAVKEENSAATTRFARNFEIPRHSSHNPPLGDPALQHNDFYGES
jgi:hypothetical protein